MKQDRYPTEYREMEKIIIKACKGIKTYNTNMMKKSVPQNSNRTKWKEWEQTPKKLFCNPPITNIKLFVSDWRKKQGICDVDIKREECLKLKVIMHLDRTDP